jgi:hypothetical protein
MRTLQFLKSARTTQLLATALTFGVCSQAMAQTPSSLSYPANNVFIANVSNVYLSPNLAGSAAGYSISPSLPAGLSFNTSTGVISGNPTAASDATSYTITALGGTVAQNTSTTTNIMVTNNFFNNNYSTISFGGTGVVLTNGATGDTIASSTNSTVGTNANDLVVYHNVATLSGKSIDCIVKTVSVSSGTSFTAYDQNETSGQNFSSNDAKFFSPQVSFPGSTSTVTGGSMQFSFQFILGGTYSTVSKSGTNIVLQNVKINTYDIDGNGSGVNSNQLNEFGGFSTSEVGGASTIQAPVFNTTTGLTTYKSNIATNSSVVTADPTRVRITYNNISDFSIRMGGGGTAYFFLDFSAGPNFATSDTTAAPSVDLNTGLIGINNSASGCATDLSFTPSGQTNITAPGNLTQMIVSFPVADITNGANERFVVTGATGTSTIPLNADPSITNMVLGGNTYSVTGTTAGGIRTLIFAKSGTFTVANAEALLDALAYSNIATTPTIGGRNFSVNVRNTSFQSPTAVFTASLNCVSVSGNVFHDVNGLVDNTVNATGTAGQFAANGVYVLRVNPTNNQVIDAQPIAAGGAFNFGTVTPGTYNFYVSNATQIAGTVINAATFPAGGYTASGENLGAAAGTDHQADGKLVVTIGSQSVTNANFGLQIPPVTASKTINNIANPGGYNGYTILANTFDATDADGTVDSIRINSFPTGANYIKIGSTVYTNGGNCPPQVTTCTAWPGTVSVPFSAGNPVPAILVDPSAEGITAAVINFTAWDNGRVTSNASDVTLNFIGSTSYNVNGNVWNDANGNGLQDSGENLIAPADLSHTFYAVLVQQTHTYSGAGTILKAMPVSTASGYSFANVPGGNDYVIQIMSLATAPVAGAASSTVSAHFAPNWMAVSTSENGTIVNNLNTTSPSLSIANLSGAKTNQNFGLERLPDATDILVPVSAPAIGTLFTLNGVSSLPVPPATDPEEGTMGAGKTFVVVTLPQYTTLRYNGAAATVGQVITNFNPSLLQVEITTSTLAKPGTSFTFNYKDAAGKVDPTPATYAIVWGVNLSVQMGEFTAVKENKNAKLDWITYSETNNKGFSVEHSTDGRLWKETGFVASAAQDGNSNEKLSYLFIDENPANGVNYYRLKQTDMDNKFTYSETRKVIFTEGNTISVYPNPAASTINVKVAEWSKVAEVSIMDVNGKVMLRTADASQGLFIGSLANGNYLLQVKQTNGDVASFKIVKQ